MDRVVIVTKATRLEELVQQYLTEGAAGFALESRGQSIDPYYAEDAAYKAAVIELRRQIPSDLSVATATRDELPNFLFRPNDLIVVCGPDGLFVNVAKYVDQQLVLTVNPDPRTVAGVLMLFSPSSVGKMIALIKAEKHQVERIPFVKATIDDEYVIWGVNDIFIGRKDHVSARYKMTFSGHTEHQSSSGIIVSTGVGSTGWLRSVAAQCAGLTGRNVPNALSSMPSATSNELVFVVREPFPSPNTGANLVTGRVRPNNPLIVTSEMPEGGFVFSDGVIEKAVTWKAGSTVTVTVGDRYIQRVVP